MVMCVPFCIQRDSHQLFGCHTSHPTKKKRKEKKKKRERQLLTIGLKRTLQYRNRTSTVPYLNFEMYSTIVARCDKAQMCAPFCFDITMLRPCETSVACIDSDRVESAIYSGPHLVFFSVALSIVSTSSFSKASSSSSSSLSLRMSPSSEIFLPSTTSR